MSDDHSRLTRRRFVVAGLGALLAACAGETGSDTAASGDRTDASPSPSPSSSPSAEASSPSPAPTPSPSETYDITTTPGGGEGLPTGIVPTRIQIPAIGVDAEMQKVNITADEVEVPDFGFAGWWVQTREPGEIGPAVIGAHVDTKSGPDVFFRLKELRPGDEITVSDEAGETRTFVVNQDPLQVDKNQRPPEVFGFTNPRPELRLITCGGNFNPNIGHYVDNIIVFSHDPTFEDA